MGNNNMAKQTAAAAVAMKFMNIEIEKTGTKVIIPESMSLDELMIWTHRKIEEENQEVSIYEEIIAFPLDAAYALTKALESKYGWVAQKPTPGFFGSNPPAMIGLEVGFGESVQVPWGRMAIPGIEDGYIETRIALRDEMPILVIGGQMKKKFQHHAQEIAHLTRKIVKENSVYRGKAIRIEFADDVNDIDPTKCPKFMDISNVKEEELIFPDSVNKLITTSLFTPIERTALCRKHKIPLKRGILLEGPYGTGKTLTANVTAKKCVNNGWTFIYLENVQQLEHALQFARQYAPAVIFAEDIDRVVTGDRTSEMDSILNTIDGVEDKDKEIITILTTNHVENINPAMLRPGRLDAVVQVRPPDAPAVVRLLELYGRNLIDADTDLTAVANKLAGNIPAVIREVVERSKLRAISRMDNGSTMHISEHDLSDAADGMLAHLELLTPHPDDKRNDVEKFADTLGYHIRRAICHSIDRGFGPDSFAPTEAEIISQRS